MLEWWLNLRWASEAYADPLARIDAAVAVVAVTLLAALIVAG